MPLGTNPSSTVTSTVYGTNASNSAFYALTTVALRQTITAATWNTIGAYINTERNRRGAASVALNVANPISAAQFNAMKTAVEIAGPAADQAYNTSGTVTVTTYPQAPVPTGATAAASGQHITAAGVNALVNEILAAGTVCTCNCNYCTCNCNYCTCNCNYACTCNCNYSDRRLKENIEYVGMAEGVMLYSFNYISDKTTTYVGAMAQDLLKTEYADAVGLDSRGYYTVDYGKLPIKFKIKK